MKLNMLWWRRTLKGCRNQYIVAYPHFITHHLIISERSVTLIYLYEYPLGDDAKNWLCIIVMLKGFVKVEVPLSCMSFKTFQLLFLCNFEAHYILQMLSSSQLSFWDHARLKQPPFLITGRSIGPNLKVINIIPRKRYLPTALDFIHCFGIHDLSI